ncbi:MAG: hypothetical protein ACTSPI_04705 [Candidatus Heimdallarchaeaceae archaeon]
MICPKCGSENVQVITKKKRRGFLNLLMNAIITIFTGGIWIIILLIKGRKDITRFICLDCKKEFK